MSSKKMSNACSNSPRYTEPCKEVYPDKPPTDISTVLSRLVDLDKQLSEIAGILDVALGTIENSPEDQGKDICNDSSIFGYLGGLQSTINRIYTLSRDIAQKLGQR